MKTIKLESLNACNDAVEYVETQKSPTLAWQNCDRGDWMLWLAKKLNVDDRKLTLAKATVVKQVEHLLKDQRSIDALAACFRYTNGEISREELNTFAAAAYAAAAAAAAASASAAYAAASYAADAASYAADAYAADAYAAASYAADAYAADAYAYAAAAYAAASYAADAYAYAADAYAADAYAYADDAYAADAADAARMESLKKSADICREILTDEVLSKYKKLRYATKS